MAAFGGGLCSLFKGPNKRALQRDILFAVKLVRLSVDSLKSCLKVSNLESVILWSPDMCRSKIYSNHRSSRAMNTGIQKISVKPGKNNTPHIQYDLFITCHNVRLFTYMAS